MESRILRKAVLGIGVLTLAGLAGIVSCKKEPPKQIQQPVEQPVRKIDSRFAVGSRALIDRNGLDVIAVPVKQGEHLWNLVRQFVAYNNNDQIPTEEQLRPYARYVMENNQRLARKEYDEVWFTSKSEVMNPLHLVMLLDTLYFPLNNIPKYDTYSTNDRIGEF